MAIAFRGRGLLSLSQLFLQCKALQPARQHMVAKEQFSFKNVVCGHLVGYPNVQMHPRFVKLLSLLKGVSLSIKLYMCR